MIRWEAGFGTIICVFCFLTGRHLATLPVDPKVGKMLLMGAVFQCLGPALTIAAALAHRDPFVLPIERKEEADEARRLFAGDSDRSVCKHSGTAESFVS